MTAASASLNTFIRKDCPLTKCSSMADGPHGRLVDNCIRSPWKICDLGPSRSRLESRHAVGFPPPARLSPIGSPEPGSATVRNEPNTPAKNPCSRNNQPYSASRERVGAFTHLPKLFLPWLTLFLTMHHYFCIVSYGGAHEST